MLEAGTKSRKLEWDALCSSLGLALVMSGRPLGWTMRGILGMQQGALFAIAPLILGLMLLLEPRWIYRVQFHTNPINLLTPVLCILFPMFALSFQDIKLTGPFTGYLLVVVPAALFVSLKDERLFRHFPFFVMTIGLIAGSSPYIAVFKGGGTGDLFARLAPVGAEHDPLALAATGVDTALAALVVFLTESGWIVGGLAALSFFVGMSAVVMSFTRSSMISISCCLFLLVFYLRNKVQRHDPGAQKDSRFWSFAITLGVLTTAAPAVLVFVLGPKLFDFMTHWGFERVGSFFNLFSGDTQVSSDASSLGHLAMMQYSWNNLNVVGHGMMAMSETHGEGVYAHQSFLEAFFDFGVFGGVIYFVFSVVIPSALIILRLLHNKISGTQAFIILCFVEKKIDAELFHATPYNWDLWLVTLLVFVLVARPHSTSKLGANPEVRPAVV